MSDSLQIRRVVRTRRLMEPLPLVSTKVAPSDGKEQRRHDFSVNAVVESFRLFKHLDRFTHPSSLWERSHWFKACCSSPLLRAARRNQHHGPPTQTPPGRAALVDRCSWRPSRSRSPCCSAGTTPAQAAAVQCSVDYKTNDWGSGFTADLTLTNRGTDAINGWTLTYAYAGNQKLQRLERHLVAVRPDGHRQRTPRTTGRSPPAPPSRTGAQFTYSGTNAAPTSFAVNGTTCTGAHQPPITVLTSPAAGAVYTQGDAVPLAATAAAADGATISKVEFYDDTTLLGTDTSVAVHALGLRLGRGQSLAVRQGVRQPGRLRGVDAGRHHGRLGPAVVASPDPTRPSSRARRARTT